MLFNILKRWSEPIPSDSQCWVFSKSPCISCPFWRGREQMLCYRMTGAVFLTWHGASWQASLSLCIGARGAASRFITGFGCWQEGTVLTQPCRLSAPAGPRSKAHRSAVAASTPAVVPPCATHREAKGSPGPPSSLSDSLPQQAKKCRYDFLLGNELKHQPSIRP